MWLLELKFSNVCRIRHEDSRTSFSRLLDKFANSLKYYLSYLTMVICIPGIPLYSNCLFHGIAGIVSTVQSITFWGWNYLPVMKPLSSQWTYKQLRKELGRESEFSIAQVRIWSRYTQHQGYKFLTFLKTDQLLPWRKKSAGNSYGEAVEPMLSQPWCAGGRPRLGRSYRPLPEEV